MTPLRVAATLPRSRVNGPGTRAVVWLQGCSMACPGCCNPGMSDPRRGAVRTVTSLLDELGGAVRGLTVSGGEPFEQPAGLAALCRGAAGLGWDVLVFTGYTLDRLDANTDPSVRRCLDAIDLLVAGPYVVGSATGDPRGLVASSNQRVHALSGRIRPEELDGIREAELTVARDGSVSVSGLVPLRP